MCIIIYSYSNLWSMSQAAIYFAEAGHRVVYITTAPLESLPRTCHGKGNTEPTTFQLMRFMYLENHEALSKRLAELHTFATLPSVLLIDDFDVYINDRYLSQTARTMKIAATCALIYDTMHSCAKILDMTVSERIIFVLHSCE